MSLTPKNWERFQHYKDRRPAWIKLHKSLLDDYEFSCLPVASRALAPCLWLLASEYEGGKITASTVLIAHRLRMAEDDLKTALKPLIDAGFFIGASDLLADCYHDASLEKRTSKKRREETRAVLKENRTDDEKVFEQFWKAYPKREGANPKQPARKAFLTAVKQGATEEAIIGGAERYRKDPATKVGTPYVTQAVTWLHQKRWTDYPETAAIAAESKTNGGGFYAKPESPQLEAWDAHRKAETGKGYPRDAAGGWHFPTEWPPGPTPAEKLKAELMAGLE